MADKKTSTRKKPTAKRPAQKKTPVVKTVKKPHAPKKQEMQSFKRAAETEPFMTFKLTRQTLYWLIIAVMVVGFSWWIFKLQADIMALYDQVEEIRMSEPQLTPEQMKKLYENGYRP